MIVPIALFKSNDRWTEVSIVKDRTSYSFLTKNDGMKIYHDEYLYPRQKTYLRELASKLGKFTNKPFSERRTIIEDIIFSIARVCKNSNEDKSEFLYLAKDGDKLFTNPYNTKAHFGNIRVTPLGVRLSSERKYSTEVERNITFTVKVAFRDLDFDGEENQISQVFMADVKMCNYRCADKCQFSYVNEDESGQVFGLDNNDIFYALLKSLTAKKPVDVAVKLFKENKPPIKDIEDYANEYAEELGLRAKPDNWVTNETLKDLIEGYEELNTNCGDFFKNVSFKVENLMKCF